MPPHPVAASVAVAPLLTGPPRPLTVAAATPAALYFATGEPDQPALCLSTSGAVRLPCALVLDRELPWPASPRVGHAAVAGAGELTLDGFAVRVARWWRPQRPRGLGRLPVPSLVARSTALAAALAERGADPLDEATRAAAAGLSAALRSTGSPAASVAALLGRGPGLTPLGDDVLAGTLVTLVALEHPGTRALASAVGELAPARTTFVSAALLHHAARGECVPELAALLRDEPGSLDALLRVGHSSGAGLAYGVLTALAAAGPAQATDAVGTDPVPAGRAGTTGGVTP